jgi:hypothetical protein
MKIDEHERDICGIKEDAKSEHSTIWTAITARVKNKLFYTFVTIVVTMFAGTLAFQWANYEKLSAVNISLTEKIHTSQKETMEKINDVNTDVTNRITAIETKIKQHIKRMNGDYEK